MTSDTHNKYVYNAHIHSTFIASYVSEKFYFAVQLFGIWTVSTLSFIRVKHRPINFAETTELRFFRHLTQNRTQEQN
jgi:hypothetical protein